MADDEPRDDTAGNKLDPIAETILSLLRAEPPGGSLDPAAVARAYAADRRKPGDPSDVWRRWLPAGRQQSRFLARRGLIVILRHGEPLDPEGPVKGLVRLALPGR